MWSTASESIRNGWYNSDRPSCSSRLAQPGLTAVDRFWFRRWSSHEPNQLHKLIECISNVFWSPEYAQKYKLCVSTSKWRVSLVWEDWADKCSLRFPGFACKLAVSLVTGIKINVHSITLVCFCLNSEARGWRHDSGKTQTNKLEWWMILKISFCISLKTHLRWLSPEGNSVICIVFLDFVRFADYVWTLLFTMFTEVQHVSAQLEMHFFLLLNSVRLELRPASESIQPL